MLEEIAVCRIVKSRGLRSVYALESIPLHYLLYTARVHDQPENLNYQGQLLAEV